MSDDIKLTQYSHGAGCGCKISPAQLDVILKTKMSFKRDPRLIIGHETKDDAAVYDLGGGVGIVSTTDFFMPIVDDPFTFGRVAATNALSDIYAMGGKPIMAVAILGWPLDKLDASVAQRVVDGGRAACQDAGISLGGGHSIDAPEPIFGLAVTGRVELDEVKRNGGALPGCELFLTKPLGVGILTTAVKRGKIMSEDAGLAERWMCQLNDVGVDFAGLSGVRAMTDVTGFGLMGHLLEVCKASGVRADVRFDDVPHIAACTRYIDEGCVPGGTSRNFQSVKADIGPLTERQRALLCDPQTSGGLLVAVEPKQVQQLKEVAAAQSIELASFGRLSAYDGGPWISVS